MHLLHLYWLIISIYYSHDFMISNSFISKLLDCKNHFEKCNLGVFFSVELFYEFGNELVSIGSS